VSLFGYCDRWNERWMVVLSLNNGELHIKFLTIKMSDLFLHCLFLLDGFFNFLIFFYSQSTILFVKA